MGKFDGVLLVSDYDDTLYNHRLEVSERNRDAIARFQAEGGRFTIATGRAYETFTPQIARERLTLNAPVILSNGSVIYDYEKEVYLHRSHLPGDAALHIQQVLTVLPELSFESYHDGKVFVYQPNEVTRRHLERVNVPYTVCERVADMEMPWVKLILEQDYPVLERAQQFILEHWGDRYEVIFSNRYLLEVTAKGNTKGALVEKLRKLLDLKPENVYCIGDNQNDIPMLAVSAIPFAPANCAPEVKEWGARLVGHCDEDAVAEVIDRLEEIYSQPGKSS